VSAPCGVYKSWNVIATSLLPLRQRG